MGHSGKLTGVINLPSDALMGKLIKRTMQLIDEGVQVHSTKTSVQKNSAVHLDFQKALNENRAAKGTFKNFSHSQQREYSCGINEVKTNATCRKEWRLPYRVVSGRQREKLEIAKT